MFVFFKQKTAYEMLISDWSSDVCSSDLAITDRKKDIVIRGGENISSREVEDLLLRIPGVREAAAVGYPDDRLGERVCAYLIVEDDLAIDRAAIDAAFQAFGAAQQKTPERVKIGRAHV